LAGKFECTTINLIIYVTTLSNFQAIQGPFTSIQIGSKTVKYAWNECLLYAFPDKLIPQTWIVVENECSNKSD